MNAGPSGVSLPSELDRGATGHEPSRGGVAAWCCAVHRLLCTVCYAAAHKCVNFPSVQWSVWARVRRAFAGDVIRRGVRGHVPEGTVWGGRVHERHERECWGGGGHRAL